MTIERFRGPAFALVATGMIAWALAIWLDAMAWGAAFNLVCWGLIAAWFVAVALIERKIPAPPDTHAITLDRRPIAFWGTLVVTTVLALITLGLALALFTQELSAIPAKT